VQVLAEAGLDGFETRSVVIAIVTVILRPATAGPPVGMDILATFGHGIPPFREMMCKGLKRQGVAGLIQNATQINAVNSSGYAGDDEGRSRGGWDCCKA